MENIYPIISQIIDLLGVWGAGAVALCLLLFLWQMCFWLRYNRIPSWRERRAVADDDPVPPVSVIVVLTEDYPYLEQTLPLVLAQDHPQFEVVAVYVGADSDFRDALDLLAAADPRIVVTQFNNGPSAAISNKMAYNLGIKAARYPNILLATDDTAPASDRWLRLMAKGFAGSEVVIGYCGVEPAPGWANRLMRADRLMLSVRYLSAAMRGHAYRGMRGNAGITSKIYFESRGFNYLNMNTGEDDLYIQSIATRTNTSVVISPACAVRQHFAGDFAYWRTIRAYYGSTTRFYTRRAKFSLAVEPITRVAFFLSVAAAIVLLPDWFRAIPAGLFLLRWAVAGHVLKRICRRLGEGGLNFAMFVFDLAGPVVEAGIRRRSKRQLDKAVWR